MTLKSIRLSILQRHHKGKRVSNNSTIMKSYLAKLPSQLSIFQKEMVIGLMLGDATLKVNKTQTAACMQFEWGDINKEYAFHVWHMLYPYCLSLPLLFFSLKKQKDKSV